MKTLYWIFRLLVVLVPLFLVVWPIPIFILPKDNVERYLEILFQMQNTSDPSRFAAIPFVWAFLSLPLAFLSLGLGLSLWYAIEVFINRPKQ
ncbi:hypothetical protein EBS40_02870 [bacterium]|nr:hypothetical protein [bacterium]